MSVLDHLGRNLYRSFATVLGEAISNSWDANANNVWIHIDKEKNSLLIKDDGDGMTPDDFQNKFLKIGYSKRKKGENSSAKGRPYIGRKGIGKLALLSCSDKIIVISKIENGEYIGGLIDNSGLDRAITEDLTPSEYPLGKFDLKIFGKHTKNHERGTIIYFENIKEGLRNSFDFLRKIIALYFRFSLLDPSFNIYLNDEKITLDDLNDLAQKTEFLWNINNLDDPYIKEKVTKLKENEKPMKMVDNVKGFIASVKKPRDLKVISTDEKVGVDLFVNGRLRERDILKHIPTDRVAVSYLYGQFHVDDLDDEKDRFTSSREGIIADDQKYKKFLNDLRGTLNMILEDWDKWRIKNKEEGDQENPRMSKKERNSIGLFNAVSVEYEIPEDSGSSENRKRIGGWVEDLAEDAKYNFASYAECFISENLVRKHIQEKNISIPSEETEIVRKWRTKESENKTRGNVSINIRQTDSDLSYLDMDPLAKIVDPQRGPACGLTNDAKQYKPIRDALMHTALLTNEAKSKLTTVYENIKGRVKTLLNGG
jgi:hypothetical protein